MFYFWWERVANTALLMVYRASMVHLRCAFGQREAVEVVCSVCRFGRRGVKDIW